MKKQKGQGDPTSANFWNLERMRHVVAMTVMGSSSFFFIERGTAAESTVELPAVHVAGPKDDGLKADEVSLPQYTQPVREIPQTVHVINKETFNMQGATTLRDVLRNVPGVSIRAGEGGQPLGDSLSLRGFSARTDIFVDGVRDFGGYTRDPFNTEQIEVVKGPSSTYAGRGSTGGSVNLSSKKPKLGKDRDVSLGVGTDAYKRGTLDVNQQFGETTSLRLNGMWHEEDVAGRDHVNNSRYGFAPSVSFGLGSESVTTLSYFKMDQDNLPDYGIPWVTTTNVPLAAYRNQAPPVSFSHFYGVLDRDREETETDLATVEHSHDFSDKVNLRGMLRHGKATRDSIVSAPRFVNDTTTNIQPNFQSRDQEDDIFTALTDLTMDFDTGKVGHTMVSGLEWSQEGEDRKYWYQIPQANFFTSLTNPSYPPYTGQIRAEDRVNSIANSEGENQTTSMFVADTLKLGKRWKLPLGLRYDHVDAEYKTDTVTGLGTTNRTTLESKDDMLSWRGGVVFSPRINGSIYFGYGTSFNPSSETLSLATTNVNLEPEKNRSMELGTKWDFLDDKLGINVAIFKTTKTNARSRDPISNVDVLAGKQEVEGFELGVTGQITKRWGVLAGLTSMDSKVEQSRVSTQVGNELSGTPDISYSLWTNYQWTNKWFSGIGLQHVGEVTNSDNNTATSNIKRAPDYTVFNAMVGYQMNKTVDFRLNANNFTDEEYIDAVGGGHFIPGVARTVMLTTGVHF